MNVMQKVYISALLFLNTVIDNYSIVDSFSVKILCFMEWEWTSVFFLFIYLFFFYFYLMNIMKILKLVENLNISHFVFITMKIGTLFASVNYS
jgi:hypothetical protein